MMKPNAIIITGGALETNSAKTAHGLIRASDRFNILGVIDQVSAGKNAAEILGEKSGNIPVYGSLKDAFDQGRKKIEYAIVGVAPKGGKLPPAMKDTLKQCLENGISLISGLHDFLSDMPDLANLAKEKGLTITDIRKPVDRKNLHFWTGKIFGVKCPIVAVLGMETNMGKRTTAKLLIDTCNKNGVHAEMIFTGQTGWLQSGKYGFVLDTTVNDFVSGELEYWVTKCYDETHPDIIFIEGQSGLRNPSGPCGAELLLSGGAKYAVLTFSPKRKYFGDNKKAWGPINSVESEIELIKLYGSKVIALAVHTKGCTSEEAKKYQKEYEEKTGLPVLLPLEKGVKEIMPVIKELVSKHEVTT
ncbi:MAG: DUF1611 domain-containing protein [Chitinophagaceae bacterium]